MRSGYRIAWTDHALTELERTVKYLELNFSANEVNRLAEKIESALRNISRFPRLYPESAQKQGVRRAVIARFNTLYYRINDDKGQIEILSFFSNREDPEKLEF